MHFCQIFGSVDLRVLLPRPAPRIFTFAPPPPAPRIFVLAPPRPAGKSSAPHIPAGHLEVRLCKQFISQDLSTSVVEIVTIAFLVLVATFTWFNGLTKSITESAEENLFVNL